MMRWLIQILVMLGDVALFAACVYVGIEFPPQVSIPLIGLAMLAFKEVGGFEAWTHPRRFLENARRGDL